MAKNQNKLHDQWPSLSGSRKRVLNDWVEMSTKSSRWAKALDHFSILQRHCLFPFTHPRTLDSTGSLSSPHPRRDKLGRWLRTKLWSSSKTHFGLLQKFGFWNPNEAKTTSRTNPHHNKAIYSTSGLRRKAHQLVEKRYDLSISNKKKDLLVTHSWKLKAHHIDLFGYEWVQKYSSTSKMIWIGKKHRSG